MRINTRFPVAVHILTALALNADEQRGSNTSEVLAKSVNTNPVVIRRIISLLKKADLVEVRLGVGGAALTQSPETILLLDIYNAVKITEDTALFDLHHNPNPKCPIGANIHCALSEPLSAAQKALEDSLATYTLQDIVDQIIKKVRYN